MEGLQCRVTAQVGETRVGPFAVPADDEVTLGRGDGAALRLDVGWVPRALARLVPLDEGWLVENGHRVPMRVSGPWCEDAGFAPEARVLVATGRTRVAWPALGASCQVGLVVGAGAGRSLPVLADAPGRESAAVPEGATGATGAARVGAPVEPGPLHVELPPAARAVLAVMFPDLLTGAAAHRDPVLAAARHYGRSTGSVAAQLGRLRRRLRAERWIEVPDERAMAEYLVAVGAVTSDDLP